MRLLFPSSLIFIIKSIVLQRINILNYWLIVNYISQFYIVMFEVNQLDHIIDMEEVYRDRVRAQFMRAARSMEFHREMEATR